MTLENGDKVLEFLTKQRDEDVTRQDKRHSEVLQLLADTSEKIMQKIDSRALETEIEFKKHYKYHEDNECIWSYNIFKWLDEHKKLIFFAGIIIGVVVIVSGTYVGYNWKDILKTIIKDVK